MSRSLEAILQKIDQVEFAIENAVSGGMERRLQHQLDELWKEADKIEREGE